MLDERRAAILKAIVEEYVASAQPVGSATVVRNAPLGVSSATVRNDMAALESLGYIRQPHTSAGRVPSDLGYRFFVDNYAHSDSLPAGDRSLVGRFFASFEAELDDLLSETCRMLARLTHLTAVVVAPQLEDSRLLSVHLTLLDPRRALAILVTRTGRVAKVSAEFSEDVSEGALSTATGILAEMLVGTEDWLTSRRPPRVEDAEVATIVRGVLEALGRAGSSSEADVYLGGAASLAERFDEADVLGDILEALEERHRLVDLLQTLLTSADGRGVVVRIGSEVPKHELQSASMVLAPYQYGGASGALGLVGPTRMDYTRAMSAVAYISELLEHTLQN